MDWQAIGRNIYKIRTLRGESQEKLAELAGLGISTIYNAEQGKPIGERSLFKICTVFTMPVEELLRPQLPLSREEGVAVHRCANSFWIAALDYRANIPSDDYARIQSAEERLRLGRLGFVGAFCTTTSFIMPNGPGLAFIELYRWFDGPINEGLYRECTIRVEQSRLRICVRDKIVELDEGDVVGYYSEELEWAEPAEPIGPTGLPVLFTWTGAVRVGNPPPSGKK